MQSIWYNKNMNKNYNNYLRKPKTEIVMGILNVLALGGLLIIASTSPYFILNLLKGFSRLNKYPKKKVYNTFYNLKKQGLIDFHNKGGQIYIQLTEKGKRKAGWMQINNLEIKKPKIWDKKWRMVMFDIAQIKRESREALRGKLKQLGFFLFQKSVWVIPYDCDKEIKMLKDFFALKDYGIRLIIVSDIGGDVELKEFFKL